LKVVFVNPSYYGTWVKVTPITKELGFHVAGQVPPLGLLYISTYLNQEGVESTVFDNDGLRYPVDRVIRWLKKEDPDIVGFSVTCAKLESGHDTHQIAQKYKEENPNSIIIYGGPLPTLAPKKILEKHTFVDYVIRGEGEYATLDLVRAIKKGTGTEDIKGLCYRKNGNIIVKKPYPFIRDLDSLPFPDRRLLRNVKYEMNLDLEAFTLKLSLGKLTTLITSRGCPFNCKFCYTATTSKGNWRWRSAENVVEEMDFLDSEGYRTVYVPDDNFTANRKRALKICELMKKHRLDIKWTTELLPKSFDRNLAKKLHRSGCEAIFMGIESASQRILNYYQKPITPSECIRAVKNARRAGFAYIVGSFMMGAPIETEDEMCATAKYIQNIDIDMPLISPTSAMYEDGLWNEMKAQGIITNKIEEKLWDRSFPVCEIHPNVDKGVVYEVIEDAYLKFLAEPQRIMKAVYRHLFTNRFRRQIVTMNLPKLPSIVRMAVRIKAKND